MACVDADYRDDGVTTACVGFDAWTDDTARIELVLRSSEPAAPYQPGAFFERELPYVLAALDRMPPLDLVIVDGYVWLGADRPGFGWHLHAHRGGAVVGVAKTRFDGTETARPTSMFSVVRGSSTRPLFVTAIGIEPALAAEHVRTMHGAHRIPTLLGLADGLARGHR